MNGLFNPDMWEDMSLLDIALVIYSVFFFVYAVTLQSVYTWLTIVGLKKLSKYSRRYPLRDYRYVAESPLSIPITIIAPGYNEEETIVQSVHSLLNNHYENIEVVVVNDGSKDNTLFVLIREFKLKKVTRAPRSSIPTKDVRGVYASPLDPRLVIIDKENGGKADALNAGVNYARYPLVCSVDADTLVDPDSLEKLVWEFQVHPETVATGGTIRIVNGCTVENGRVVDIRTPKRMLPAIQVAEYLRAFLGGRIGWSNNGMLLIISGAFGLFRRQALVNVGGYDTNTVGEDAELVLRLHRYYADNNLPFRASFFPDPVCWTEAPSTFRMLSRQRNRWQRGLVEMLFKHKGMLFNPRYGRVGMFALPYYWFFELFGPVIEVLGYLSVIVFMAFGLINPPIAIGLLVASLLYGFFLTIVAVIMEDSIPGRYRRWSDIGIIMVASFVENFGYRQWQAYVRARAVVSMLWRRDKHWGEMTRQGFKQAEPNAVSDSSAPQTI